MLQASGRFVVGSSVAWAAGCATTRDEPAAAERSHRLLHPRVVVTAPAGAGPDDQRWVDEVLPDALARLSAFELSLATRVEVRLHSSRRSFERDTGRKARWLRAWAGYDVIHLLAPSTWRDPSRAARLERLTHELAHAATFHSLGDERAALRVRPPFWFREGAASVIAQQEVRRMPLRLVVQKAGASDPVVDADGWLGRNHYVAYAAAHHTVALLVARHGTGVIARILRRAKEDGAEGAVDRALHEMCDIHLHDLWAEVRSSSSAHADNDAPAKSNGVTPAARRTPR